MTTHPKWHETVHWGIIPEYMKPCIIDYVENGKIDDDFLIAIVSNDLKAACTSADNLNQCLLFSYVQFFYNNTPSVCWGDHVSVNDWIQKGGLYGTGDEDEREHT